MTEWDRQLTIRNVIKIGIYSKMLKNDTVVPAFPLPPSVHIHTQLKEISAESVTSRMMNEITENSKRSKKNPEQLWDHC